MSTIKKKKKPMISAEFSPKDAALLKKVARVQKISRSQVLRNGAKKEIVAQFPEYASPDA